MPPSRSEASVDAFAMETLLGKDVRDLYSYAREMDIQDYETLSKKELAQAIHRNQEEKQGFFNISGVLDYAPGDNYGFIRPINYSPSREDVYISASQVHRFGLRNGDWVTGPARPPKPNERYYGLMQISTVNGQVPEEAAQRDHFPSLVPLYPNRQLVMEYQPDAMITRMMDVTAPVGFGQRGLIVAPPKTGKTTILKEIAQAIAHNYPEVHLILLLIDERPEEVTDLERTIRGEVASSTFDQKPNNHVRLAELVLDRAMRLVEAGRDVVVLMDSITRLTRAYNLVIPPSGRTLSGGLDPVAFHFPKMFFGAARNIEDGGSLTILATALVDTGSRMDEVIYEEFKGTGNLELHLSRDLAERRIFPAMDIKRSGTRREDLLLDPDQLESVWRLRRMLGTQSLEYTDQLIQLMTHTPSNADFFHELDKLTGKVG